MSTDKYDVVFSFDTTGSMSSCIGQVRRSIKDITKRLFKEIPNMRIGIVAHGDYCDKDRTYLMKHIDLSSDADKIIEFVNTVGNTGGGDYPEAYEYVLREVQKFGWDSLAMRSLVMIGDAYPHPVDKNPEKIDWRVEVDEISKMGINIYSVQALNSGKGESYTFYKQMASKTGGYHLFLNQFSHIADMFIAICLKHLSDDKVVQYEQEITTKLGGLTNSMRQIFDTLLNRKKKIDHEDELKMIEDYNPDDDKITPCPPAKYQLLHVDNNDSIKNFVLANGLTFKTGKGFYEFTKPELISPKKMVVLMKKDTGELYEGHKARSIAKISNVSKKYKPTDLPDYRVFIQSTSYNRKLIGGTSFLYEAADWIGH